MMNQPARQAHSAITAPSRVSPGASFNARAEAEALVHQEFLLDESLMQTFPASDAISPGFIT
jgi:hypothetical protein